MTTSRRGDQRVAPATSGDTALIEYASLFCVILYRSRASHNRERQNTPAMNIIPLISRSRSAASRFAFLWTVRHYVVRFHRGNGRHEAVTLPSTLTSVD